jgi:hypothetical protein
MDLHTTSGPSVPFLTVSDSLLNRTFTELFPVPMVLGIEEYLNGAMLSYLNELGFVSFGFEGGQHDEHDAIQNHVAFIYLSLAYAGSIDNHNQSLKKYHHQLKQNAEGLNKIYEIFQRHVVQDGEQFEMKPGYVNFQPVQKWDTLAVSNGTTIMAERTGRILMPRYYNQGDDGYFFIRSVPKIMLRVSALMRSWRLNRILPLLPGVKWYSKKEEVLQVDLRIAKFLTKQIFHLMGYRTRVLNENTYVMKNREAAARGQQYPVQRWRELHQNLEQSA